VTRDHAPLAADTVRLILTTLLTICDDQVRVPQLYTFVLNDNKLIQFIPTTLSMVNQVCIVCYCLFNV
jgi:hypothetical protein